MRSEAKTVKEYLDGLPEERRKALSKVRAVVRKNLAKGFRESMNWGMITYEVPLSLCPDTYNGKPLLYAALASQKNHMAIYLTGCYMSDATRREFESAYAAAGKRLDAGKSCVRFKKVEDLPLEVIGDAVAEYTVEEFVKRAQAITASGPRKRRGGTGAGAKTKARTKTKGTT